MKEMLHAYLDGELPAADVARVEAELARDPALLEELEAIRSVDDALGTLPGHDAPAEFTERVLARAARSRSQGRILRLGLPLAAAAALMLAVFLPPAEEVAVSADPFTTGEHIDYVWETDAETFGSLSMQELENQILSELDPA